MNKKHMKLAADFLDILSEKMGNAGCNDWEWPEDWTERERDNFAMAYHATFGDIDDFKHGMSLHDFCAADMLSCLLNEEAENDDMNKDDEYFVNSVTKFRNGDTEETQSPAALSLLSLLNGLDVPNPQWWLTRHPSDLHALGKAISDTAKEAEENKPK